MKLIKDIEVKMEISNIDITKSLAAGSGKEQAQFLGLFLRSLTDTCKDNHKLQLQLCDIADNLGVDGRELIASLHGYININNQPNG